MISNLRIRALIRHYLGFPGGSDGKEPTCNAGDQGLIPGSGRLPGGGNGYPEFNGQRSLVGYSPWSCKDLDMTNTFTFIALFPFINNDKLKTF